MRQRATPAPYPAVEVGVGAPAPDFTLHATPDQTVALREFRGRPVVLAFYPADWSPVCGDPMALYNELRAEFARFGAQLLGVSVDGVWCHRAFADARHLHIPLLADFEPKGAVARAYGVYRDADGTTERALFVLDGEGIVRWRDVSPVRQPRRRRHPRGAGGPQRDAFSTSGRAPRRRRVVGARMSQHRPSHTHAGTLHAAATLQPPVGPEDHAQGPGNAPVTLVEYGDYQCPYCGQAYPVVRALQRRLGDRLRSRARVDRAGTTRAHSMRNLLAFAIDVAGGLDRRNDFAALRGGVSIGGAIWDVKRQPGKLVDKGFDVRTHEQHVTVSSFSAVGGGSVFVTGRLVLERF